MLVVAATLAVAAFPENVASLPSIPLSNTRVPSAASISPVRSPVNAPSIVASVMVGAVKVLLVRVCVASN